MKLLCMTLPGTIKNHTLFSHQYGILDPVTLTNELISIVLLIASKAFLAETRPLMEGNGYNSVLLFYPQLPIFLR